MTAANGILDRANFAILVVSHLLALIFGMAVIIDYGIGISSCSGSTVVEYAPNNVIKPSEYDNATQHEAGIEAHQEAPETFNQTSKNKNENNTITFANVNVNLH